MTGKRSLYSLFPPLLSGFLCFLAPARAGAVAAAGSTSLNFLELDAGARATALSGAFTGLANSVDAIAYNPAGLADLPRAELTFMHNQYLPGARQEWMAFAQPTADFGTLGVSLNTLSVDPFASYDANDNPTGRVSALDTALGAAYAIRLGFGLSVGAGGQLIRSRLAGKSATGVAYDFGAHFKPLPLIEFGAALLHVGPPIRYSGEDSQLPRTLKFGVALHPLFWLDDLRVDQRFIDHVSVLVDASLPENQSVLIASGLEFAYGPLYIRGGGRNGGYAGPGYTVGVGLALSRLDKNKPELDFDYAFVDSGDLGQAQRASVTLKFGTRLKHHNDSAPGWHWPWTKDGEPRRKEEKDREPTTIYFSPSSL
ncbi:MAG: PorV/PorQ family protein [Elusimicrobia bacterium]|nr:PorV/PorQ family protein [Elusimicrobiota bacterium]